MPCTPARDAFPWGPHLSIGITTIDNSKWIPFPSRAKKTSTRLFHEAWRRYPVAPSHCNVERLCVSPGETGMCVYFATGEVSPNRNDPPSTNFAKRGRRERPVLKEWTFFSLGTDPDVQDNIEQKEKPSGKTFGGPTVSNVFTAQKCSGLSSAEGGGGRYFLVVVWALGTV